MTTPPLPELSTALLHDPKQLASQLQQQRAAAGAEELEAGLFSQVLEKIEKSLSITDEENSDAGHDSWSAIGVHALAQALAHQHLLGIASMVEKSLGLPPAGAAAPTDSAAGAAAGSGAVLKKSSPELNPLRFSAEPPIQTEEGVGIKE